MLNLANKYMLFLFLIITDVHFASVTHNFLLQSEKRFIFQIAQP